MSSQVCCDKLETLQSLFGHHGKFKLTLKDERNQEVTFALQEDSTDLLRNLAELLEALNSELSDSPVLICFHYNHRSQFLHEEPILFQNTIDHSLLKRLSSFVSELVGDGVGALVGTVVQVELHNELLDCIKLFIIGCQQVTHDDSSPIYTVTYLSD